MRGPEGGFMSALDADSEGEEGLFYVWTPDQLREVARTRGRRGGRGVLRRPARAATSRAARSSTRGADEPPNLADLRRRLYEARAERVWPGLDDKRLTAWNALVIAALAEAGAVLERADFLDAARDAAEFVLRDLRDDRRSPAAHVQGRPGQAQRLPGGPRLPARRAAGAVRGHVRAALVHARPGTLADTMIERFADDERGGFFETSTDHEQLVARRKDLEDHPIPSGNAARRWACCGWPR